MYLTELSLSDFRCYEHAQFKHIERLTVFIGENDAGKTVLLDAVEILVSGKVCQIKDFRRLTDGCRAEKVTIIGKFRIDSLDILPEDFRSGPDGDMFSIKRCFVTDGTSVRPETLVLGRGFTDDRFADFNGADNQKNLLRELGIVPASNDAGRRDQLSQLIADGAIERTERDLTLSPTQSNNLIAHMPLIERISSIEYRAPENIIQRTLQKVAATVIAPNDPATGEPRELPELQEVRAEIVARFNAEIAKVVPHLQAHHKKLQNVLLQPTIDFAKAVMTTSIILDCGEGEQTFDAFGEGTKKRIWMGLLEWERGAITEGAERSMIRMYDEPDVNLHYEAQRQLFANIASLAGDPGARTQCLVCTHSVSLIDRAPSASVNLIRIGEDNQRTLTRIRNADDADVIDFFNDIGQAIGLSNTILLFERGFLIVEGESEEVAIPIIYRNIYKRSMREDGLVLVNLYSCSAWKSVLQVLLNNRMEMTHILLDTDCQEAASSGYISQALLDDIGCSPDFHAQQVTYIGNKEFEDAFDSRVIARALNTEFPLTDGRKWSAEAIERLKAESEKFSEEVKTSIRLNSEPKTRGSAKKPMIASAVARECTEVDAVPRSLLEIFEKLRARAGITA